MSEDNKSGFARLASNKGSKMLLGGVGVAVVGALAYVSLVSPPAQLANSATVAPPPSGKGSNQGGATITPAYLEAINQGDSQRIEDARKSGGSALPTPVAPNTTRQINPLFAEVADEAPADLPPVKPPVVRPEPKPPVQTPVQPVRSQQPAQPQVMPDQALMQAMQQALTKQGGIVAAMNVPCPTSGPMGQVWVVEERRISGSS